MKWDTHTRRIQAASAFWSSLVPKAEVGNLLEMYIGEMTEQGISENTIYNYTLVILDYQEWYTSTFGVEVPGAFHTVNVKEYLSYKRNIQNLKAESLNAKIAALTSFNRFLVEHGILKEMTVSAKDHIKVQTQYASPSSVSKQQIEEFRQKVLLGQGARDYALVTLLAYAGLRISEAIRLELRDVSLPARELRVREGKGNKERVVYLKDKIIEAIRAWLRERPETDSPFLFVGRQGRGKQMDRSRFNQIFKQYSKTITPHTLRHFYCSNALEHGFSIAEVAAQAGHSNVHTTLRYTNPTRERMKEKANRL